MLKQRVITAIVLLLVLAGVLACPLPWAFGALMTLFMAAAAWEWARLSGYQMAASLGFATVAMLGWTIFKFLQRSLRRRHIPA